MIEGCGDMARTHSQIQIVKFDIVLSATCIPLEVTSKHSSKLFLLVIDFCLLSFLQNTKYLFF